MVSISILMLISISISSHFPCLYPFFHNVEAFPFHSSKSSIYKSKTPLKTLLYKNPFFPLFFLACFLLDDIVLFSGFSQVTTGSTFTNVAEEVAGSRLWERAGVFSGSSESNQCSLFLFSASQFCLRKARKLLLLLLLFFGSRGIEGGFLFSSGFWLEE